MAENIVIKITAESDLKKANADLQALQDNERDISNEMRKQQAEYTKQLALVQQNIKGREAQIAAIDKLTQAQTKNQKSLEDELKKTKANLSDYNAKLSNLNDTVAAGAVQAPKLITQLRQLKAELAKMEAEGVDPSSKGFREMSIRAGELQDQLGDTRQRVAILSSDTRKLDTVMGLGQGLAGGFTAATSAAALLGGESEELTKAFLKVQAVMSILNGVNEVALMLNKDSVVMVNLSTFAQESNTVSKVKNYTATAIQTTNTVLQTAAESNSTAVRVLATSAQWLFNTAVSAFPAVAFITALTAVVGAFSLFVSSSREAESEQRKLNNTLSEYDKNAKVFEDSTNQIIDIMKASGKTSAEIRAKEKEFAQQKVDESFKSLQAISSNENATKEQREQALKSYEKALDEQLKLKRSHEVAIVQENTNAAIKAKEVADKAAKDAKAAQQAEKQLVIDMKKSLANTIKQNIQTENGIEIAENAAVEKQKADEAVQIAKDEQARKELIWADGLERYKNTKKNEVEADKKAAEEKEAIIQGAWNLGQELGNAAFEVGKNQRDGEMQDLELLYADKLKRAEGNAKLTAKLEDDLRIKKGEINLRAAKAEKDQALFNIGIATAQNIVKSYPNPILMAFAAAIGLAQAGAVNSRPLPKYARGRKGGKGEWATVGEHGAENVWLPEGASVVPAHLSRNMSMATALSYGGDNAKIMTHSNGQAIDYNKLGRAVAENMKFPKQKAVTVNVDRNGVVVQNGLQTTTFHNKKYSAQWS